MLSSVGTGTCIALSSTIPTTHRSNTAPEISMVSLTMLEEATACSIVNPCSSHELIPPSCPAAIGDGGAGLGKGGNLVRNLI